MELVDRFLKYSLERGVKISAVLMEDGAIRKTNLQVVSIDEDGGAFTARFPGRKKEVRLKTDSVLTLAYARGDRGELED